MWVGLAQFAIVSGSASFARLWRITEGKRSQSDSQSQNRAGMAQLRLTSCARRHRLFLFGLCLSVSRSSVPLPLFLCLSNEALSDISRRQNSRELARVLFHLPQLESAQIQRAAHKPAAHMSLLAIAPVPIQSLALLVCPVCRLDLCANSSAESTIRRQGASHGPS